MQFNKFLLPALVALLLSGSVRAENMIINGDFESPVVSSHFGWFSSIPGWTASQNQIEIQVNNGFFGGRQVVGQALQPGTQFVELDSSVNGAMYQDVPTDAGATYDLEFYYSPRNGFDGRMFFADSNIIEVYWEGNLVDSITDDGPNVPVNQWELFSYELTASSTTGLSRLEFAAAGVSDARGGLIYKVSLVPEPAGASCLAALAAMIALGQTRRRKTR